MSSRLSGVFALLDMFVSVIVYCDLDVAKSLEIETCQRNLMHSLLLNLCWRKHVLKYSSNPQQETSRSH